MKKLGLERIILIGHSMGGDVIAEAARRLPGRVVCLVWVDTYKQLGKGRTPEEVEAFAAKFRVNFAESTRVLVRGLFLPAPIDHSSSEWRWTWRPLPPSL